MDKIMNRKSWSPIKENLLAQRLAGLERSPSGEDYQRYGSQSSINQEENFVETPSEAKRRRLMPDDIPSSLCSQVSSQVSSRSHSPTMSECLLDDSLMSTPSMSPSNTLLKEHFRRKYRKDELWAAIETNYKYLMDKGIIEACQMSQEGEMEEATRTSHVSFQEFLTQYKEISDWLKTIEAAISQKASSTLALSEKYLNRSYYEELERSPKLQLLNDYATQLKTCQPVLREEVDVFLKEVNTQWTTILTAVKPKNLNQDPLSMLKDLEVDLGCLKGWLDGIEDHLKSQMSHTWQYEELESVVVEHKIQQRDIEAHSRVISAVLKLSDHLQENGLEPGDLHETSAHSLERRWHGLWLQSLEWQCRLEDAIARKKGIVNPGPYLDTFASLREFTDDDDDDYSYDSRDVTSGGEDIFPGFGLRSDFIQSPQKSDSSLSLSPEFDQSSGKDSAVASESEQKTSSDMSENYQDLSVSTGSESEREFLRQIRIKKHDSRDIGYGSESQSDELESRYKGVTFTGINGRARKSSKNDYYATVVVDTSSSSNDKAEGWTSANAEQKSDDSDINGQVQNVLKQEEPEMEDIRFLIDQADIMVQQGNAFNKTYSPQRSIDGKDNVGAESHPESLSSSSSSAQPREMIDKGVGTIESSCDASDEESGDSDGHQEDGTETIDSVLASEYTSDETKNGVRDYSRLPKLYDTTTLKTRLKGRTRAERPWSVIELPNVTEAKHISTSESAIDKLSAAFSDSDIPSNKSQRSSHSLSPTLPRHRIRRLHRPVANSLNHGARSQLGAKRKLDLNLEIIQPTLSSETQDIFIQQSAEIISSTPKSAQLEPVHFNSILSTQVINHQPDLELTPVKTPVNSEQGISGMSHVVPFIGEPCTSEDERTTPHKCNGLMSRLQNARFKSSGSSNDSDTQGEPTAASEIDDPNNDGNFSENAWDNYQAPLYATGSEEPPEDALTWEPGEMEFDDEFSLPQSTILATLLARRSDEEVYTGKHPKLVPSSQGQYEDSDSDIEDLNHILEESRMQLKVADRSLRKKRKDPLKTGLHLNPGKYDELMATIETNIRCLGDISQHIDQADVSEQDVQKIQDLLYQWQKLHGLASDRRNQSQEVKTMYATFLTVEGAVAEGVPQLEKRKFKSIDDLRITGEELLEKQKFLLCQKQMLGDMRVVVTTFSTQNPSVNMDGFLDQINTSEMKIDDLLKRIHQHVGELEHIGCMWREYIDTRRELEFLLTQERELLQKIAFSQEVNTDGNRVDVENDLKSLVQNLSIYEDKLIALQRLRSELVDLADEDSLIDLTAGIADIRNQLFFVKQQCQHILNTDADVACQEEMMEKDVEQDSGLEGDQMEVDEDMMEHKLETVAMQTKQTSFVEPQKTEKAAKKVKAEKKIGLPSWLRSFPLQAVAFAVFLGMLYLFAPKSLHKLLDFTFRITPELDYVNGPPPV
ncbi:uncharacterized protein LOC128208037 [Mya arenaria]|uniref:uncharacterized protein LOC128208037 n=1 Tax=Mya arenaria TaxID=6604 RepID=UPI0022E3A654|nr:uncharacterized protein LOC128208037 [Mya arenaria]XP_052767292.1 uncharacterized protein LOC128208037 [Mya arenaria]XP_052767293.1 uncharacterized protein LOC128208037 [Mya arenaria]XP_052767294.1 uncharacterized protein LOC128208037 [Mya arenaria]